MIDPKNFFHQPVKGCLRTWYDNIQKVAAGQWDDYTTGCLLDYPYLKKHKLIAVDLSQQQALDTDPKAMQQINFAANLEQAGNNVFHYWRSKKNHFRFFTRNCKNTVNLFSFNIQGGLQKCPYFSLAITFTNIRKPLRFFLHSYWKFIEFLVETILESIMFYYTFSVINTMFVPCTALLYEKQLEQ